ncbi:hypothetical protein AVEN_40747-1 [Araneus ventricosus]|uniref:Uncharacterized protein n=1 Tax=Araneus ventricosus TaxID=182803 RepID=A0A4Y2EMD5_ARAVE|nr:hypothetical protein AVEN_40747-1 [Araneus ventricosus]
MFRCPNCSAILKLLNSVPSSIFQSVIIWEKAFLGIYDRMQNTFLRKSSQVHGNLRKAWVVFIDNKWDLFRCSEYLQGGRPQLDQVQEFARPQKTIDERFMVKEESAASVGTRPWTPEGRSLTLSIAFML